ncbi:MAG TPA: YceI family protein [Bacteroidia bacterium]|nr:YceI family protein [Bacteroidia bacterium]
MKKIFFTTLFLLLALIGFTQNQQWAISSSNITFKIKNAGFTVNGKFGNVTGSIQFDATKVFGNKIEASIDANTINTDNSTRDGHLKKEEYFYVDKFPKVNMSTTIITKETNGQFKGLFTLTIKGISKIVPVLFTVTEQEDKAKFMGSFTINRLDYTVGSSSFILSDNVIINIDVACVKK